AASDASPRRSAALGACRRRTRRRRTGSTSEGARTSGRPTLRWVFLEAVFLDLRVEQTAVNTQHFRGFRAISGGVAESLHDEVLLELGDGFLEEGLLDGDLVTAFFFMLAGLVIAERQLTARDDLP